MILGDYMTLAEYARRRGIHPETVRRHLRRGKIEGVRIGQSWMIYDPMREAPPQDIHRESCTACHENPRGDGPIFLDKDGNEWHLECAMTLLTRYVQVKNGSPAGTVVKH